MKTIIDELGLLKNGTSEKNYYTLQPNQKNNNT